MARGRGVVLRVFVGGEAWQQRGSARGPTVLVFGRRAGGGRGRFGRADRGVVRRYTAMSPWPLRVTDAQRLPCGRWAPHAVVVKELVTAAMNTREALAAAMAAGRCSFSAAVQGVVERPVFERQ